MAVIRRDIPATTKDIYANRWMLTIVEGMAQEQDAGRLVYLAQATGKRMTRTEDGKFVGLDGSAVTEADLKESFVPVLVHARRMEATIGFDGDDEAATVNDLKAVITRPQFTKVKAALKILSSVGMEQKVGDIEGATIVEGEESPLDKM